MNASSDTTNYFGTLTRIQNHFLFVIKSNFLFQSYRDWIYATCMFIYIGKSDDPLRAEDHLKDGVDTYCANKDAPIEGLPHKEARMRHTWIAGSKCVWPKSFS